METIHSVCTHKNITYVWGKNISTQKMDWSQINHPISGYCQDPLCQKCYPFWNYHNYQVCSSNWRKKTCNKNVEMWYSTLDRWDIYLPPVVGGKHQNKKSWKKCSWALCQPVTSTKTGCSTTTREIKMLVGVCAQREREFQNIHLPSHYLNTYNCV